MADMTNEIRAIILGWVYQLQQHGGSISVIPRDEETGESYEDELITIEFSKVNSKIERIEVTYPNESNITLTWSVSDITANRCDIEDSEFDSSNMDVEEAINIISKIFS